MQSPANETFTVKGVGVAEGVGVAVGSGVGVGVAVGSGVVASVSVSVSTVVVVRPVLTGSVEATLRLLNAQPAKTATARVKPAVNAILRNVVHSELKCLIS